MAIILEASWKRWMFTKSKTLKWKKTNKFSSSSSWSRGVRVAFHFCRSHHKAVAGVLHCRESCFIPVHKIKIMYQQFRFCLQVSFQVAQLLPIRYVIRMTILRTRGCCRGKIYAGDNGMHKMPCLKHTIFCWICAHEKHAELFSQPARVCRGPHVVAHRHTKWSAGECSQSVSS